MIYVKHHCDYFVTDTAVAILVGTIVFELHFHWKKQTVSKMSGA